MNKYAALTQPSQPRFLMCRPQYFAVTYSINPWMNPQVWADSGEVLHATAAQQWAGLHRTLLARDAAIEAIEPEPGLPDLVFTANAAVVLNRKAIMARFFHPERRREQPAIAAGFRALQAHGLIDEVVEMPEGVTLEGAGDCIWDRWRGLFWMGCGFRSDTAASCVIEEQFGVCCLPLPLADPRFYHLDTAFCALPHGDVLYYPKAFTAAALDTIHEHVARLRSASCSTARMPRDLLLTPCALTACWCYRAAAARSGANWKIAAIRSIRPRCTSSCAAADRHAA
jgi:N-dimethylarginine dimethylaminohydrolase